MRISVLKDLINLYIDLYYISKTNNEGKEAEDLRDKIDLFDKKYLYDEQLRKVIVEISKLDIFNENIKENEEDLIENKKKNGLLEMRTVSKPGAALEVKAVKIPDHIQQKIAEAIREARNL